MPREFKRALSENRIGTQKRQCNRRKRSSHAYLLSTPSQRENNRANGKKSGCGWFRNLLICPPTVLRNGATARKKFVKVSLKRWSVCNHVQRDAMRRIDKGHKNIWIRRE